MKSGAFIARLDHPIGLFQVFINPSDETIKIFVSLCRPMLVYLSKKIIIDSKQQENIEVLPPEDFKVTL